VQKVLQNLLREGVAIRDLGTILEALGDYGTRTKDAGMLTEYVRQQLARAICHPYRDASGEPVASLIECRLESGRTHQIRVHLAAIGHPVLGDAVYGAGFKTKSARLPEGARAAVNALGRQALHAHILVVEHPVTGEILRFRSELPEELATLRRELAASGARPAALA